MKVSILASDLWRSLNATTCNVVSTVMIEMPFQSQLILFTLEKLLFGKADFKWFFWRGPVYIFCSSLIQGGWCLSKTPLLAK